MIFVAILLVEIKIKDKIVHMNVGIWYIRSEKVTQPLNKMKIDLMWPLTNIKHILDDVRCRRTGILNNQKYTTKIPLNKDLLYECHDMLLVSTENYSLDRAGNYTICFLIQNLLVVYNSTLFYSYYYLKKIFFLKIKLNKEAYSYTLYIYMTVCTM